jgi:uncharacterized protein
MDIALILVAGASFLAGLIDAIAGGGGLILLPSLFGAFPDVGAATLLGTNKSAGIWGTTVSALRYAQRVRLTTDWLIPAAAAALLGGFLGAWSSTLISPTLIRRLLPFLLFVVFAYTLVNRDLGLNNNSGEHTSTPRMPAIGIGLTLGWYDGFFGPGTGSFFVFLLVKLLKLDFLTASAASKVLNVATNLAALCLFTWTGHVWWQTGLILAFTNILGSLVGTRLALRYGSKLVRRVFLLVAFILMLKSGQNAFMSP